LLVVLKTPGLQPLVMPFLEPVVTLLVSVATCVWTEVIQVPLLP